MPSTEYNPYDNLLSGGVSPMVSKGVILQQGGVYERGTVLALVSVANNVETVTPVASTATGTLAEPHAILADPVIDATTEAQSCAVYYTGEFNSKALKFQGTDTADTFYAAMRAKGMFIKTNL